jgi:hypothetical protein
MNTMMLIAIIIITVAPLFVAFRFGDRILDGLSRRSRQSKKSVRRRRTQSLPIHDEEIVRLLGAEGRREQLDESIAKNLGAFARLPSTRSQEDSETELEATERAILDKESQFGVYLDYAWLQSETLEVLSEEARLLRQLADLPEEGLPATASDWQPTKRDTAMPASAVDKLLANLQRAQERKTIVDRKLKSVGHVIAKDSGSNADQSETDVSKKRGEAGSPGRPTGGTFDTTIGDDSID